MLQTFLVGPSTGLGFYLARFSCLSSERLCIFGHRGAVCINYLHAYRQPRLYRHVVYVSVCNKTHKLIGG